MCVLLWTLLPDFGNPPLSGGVAFPWCLAQVVLETAAVDKGHGARRRWYQVAYCLQLTDLNGGLPFQSSRQPMRNRAKEWNFVDFGELCGLWGVRT
eukprot:1833201-Amphidinium_carterae.1